MKRFSLELIATASHDGAEQVKGYTKMTTYINNPPVNGTCSILRYDEKQDEWIDTNFGLALVQIFKLFCGLDWIDPDGHRITKFVFKCKLSG